MARRSGSRDRGSRSTIAYRRIRVALLTLAVAGCTVPFRADPPGPHVPRLTSFEVAPSRITAGCAVELRFEFQDGDGDIVGALVHWTVERNNSTIGSGTEDLSVDATVFAGKRRGRVVAVLQPPLDGRVWYSVQAVDGEGHRSNVLTRPVVVHAPWWPAKRPACS